MIVTTIILAIALQASTVAVIPAPDKPAIVMQASEAQRQFKQLCADGSDDKLLVALAAALNPMPNWPQMVMNGDASVCQRNPKPIILVPLKNQ